MLIIMSLKTNMNGLHRCLCTLYIEIYAINKDAFGQEIIKEVNIVSQLRNRHYGRQNSFLSLHNQLFLLHLPLMNLKAILGNV